MRGDEFKIEVQPSGSLLITATQAGRDWLAKRQQEPGNYGSDGSWILQDALRVGGSRAIADGGFDVFHPTEVSPNPYGQRPYDGRPQCGFIVAAGMVFNDEGPQASQWALIDDVVADRLWWFPQAEQLNPIDELRTKGFVLLESAPAPQPKASASFGL